MAFLYSCWKGFQLLLLLHRGQKAGERYSWRGPIGLFVTCMEYTHTYTYMHIYIYIYK